MTPKPSVPDYILYLALVNSAAKRAEAEAKRYARGTVENMRHFAYCRYLYRVKANAAARLAYLGRLKLGLLDYERAVPAALLIGYSPTLGYHAFHLPLYLHPWPAGLERTNARSAPYKRARIEDARKDAPALDDMVAALMDLPPLPFRVARAWGIADERRTWREIEADRASAPGGVPRQKGKPKRRRKPYDRNKPTLD